MENNETLKASRFEIEQQLNLYIGNIKVEGLSKEAKLALVKLKLELSDIVKDIEAFRKKTVESIDKPENFDELKAAAEKEDATEEDKKAYKEAETEFNTKFAEIAVPYFNEIVEIPFEHISKEDFYKLVENNDTNVIFGYEYLFNKLVKHAD